MVQDFIMDKDTLLATFILSFAMNKGEIDKVMHHYKQIQLGEFPSVKNTITGFQNMIEEMESDELFSRMLFALFETLEANNKTIVQWINTKFESLGR